MKIAKSTYDTLSKATDLLLKEYKVDPIVLLTAWKLMNIRRNYHSKVYMPRLKEAIRNE